MATVRAMRTRFTLVELMVVIAIVATLAAIAIPKLHAMQMKARLAEVPVVVDGVATATHAYFASHDSFPEFSLGGGSSAVGTSTGWNNTPGWQKFGFHPSGGARASYLLNVSFVHGTGQLLVTMDMNRDGSEVIAWGNVYGGPANAALVIAELNDYMACFETLIPWTAIATCGHNTGNW